MPPSPPSKTGKYLLWGVVAVLVTIWSVALVISIISTVNPKKAPSWVKQDLKFSEDLVRELKANERNSQALKESQKKTQINLTNGNSELIGVLILVAIFIIILAIKFPKPEWDDIFDSIGLIFSIVLGLGITLGFIYLLVKFVKWAWMS